MLALQLAPALGAIAAPLPPSCFSADHHRKDAWSRPPAFGHLADPDEVDEIAALEAIRIALSEVGDGSAYLWFRRQGGLSGLVQPVVSFTDPVGRVCRHIVLLIVRGDRTGRVEGTACRLSDGRWDLAQ
jgi:surface antigen